MRVAMLLLLLSIASSTYAGSATWKASPATGDWNTATNWMPQTIPNGPSDTATFAMSNTTSVFLSADIQVNGIAFNSGASAFSYAVGPASLRLTISGVGLTNSSGIAQDFVTNTDANGGGTIIFENSSTAGDLALFTNNGALTPHGLNGETQFLDQSNAGHATVISNGAQVNGGGPGFTFFYGNSTAANGTFITNPSLIAFNQGGRLDFADTSSAGNGTVINKGANQVQSGGGSTVFHHSANADNSSITLEGGTIFFGGGGDVTFVETSTAGNATLTSNGGLVSGAFSGHTNFLGGSSAGHARVIANGGIDAGGQIIFLEDSTGGMARVEVFDNGFLDISGHNAPGMSIGSIEGSGLVFLGALNLAVGSNNRSTTFSGVIQDGGMDGGTGASLTKIGRGKLVLKHRNTYSGGTTVEHGKLFVNNIGASGTGTGPVQVNGGELGGAGTIAGAVTVGIRKWPGSSSLSRLPALN